MSAIRNKATRTPRTVALEPTPRHLWLASLGAVVAARRGSKSVAQRAAARIGNTVADARYALRRAEAGLRSGVDGMRSQFEPKVACISSEVEARLAPIVAKLGLEPKSRRAPRKAGKAVGKSTRRPVRQPRARAAKKAAR